MKVIDPLMSTGPSARVEVVDWSDSEVRVRLARQILIGAMVHLRAAGKILMGEVRHCHAMESGHEIHIRVLPTIDTTVSVHAPEGWKVWAERRSGLGSLVWHDPALHMIGDKIEVHWRASDSTPSV
jgi:hypothetical protein